MNQGCPHEGKDHRLFGRIGCWVQSRLSWHTTNGPKQKLLLIPVWWNSAQPLTFGMRWPPYAVVILPLKGQRYFSIRIGARWDPHWPFDDSTGRTGGYIFPEAIIKVMDHVVL